MKAPCGPQRARSFQRGASGLSKTKGRDRPNNNVLVTRRAARGEDALSLRSAVRGASRYPMFEGSVLRSCLDPPQRWVRTSAADLQSNRPGTDYRVDPL